MSNYWKNWLKAAGIRAVKTVAQTARCELDYGGICISTCWHSVIAYKYRRYPGSEGE